MSRNQVWGTPSIFHITGFSSRMGNTLDQHRVAIGGFSARQLSHGWKLSSNRNFVPLKRTESNRRTPSHAVVLLFSLMTMACPLVQQVYEHVLRDCGSFQMDGAGGSKVVCLQPSFPSGSFCHQSTERGTLSFFSNNFKLTTMIQKRDGGMETEPTLWVSLQVRSFLSGCSLTGGLECAG